LLSNQEIKDELDSGDLEIYSLERENIGPATVDLRLSNSFKRYRSDDATSCLIDSNDGVSENLHEEIESDSIVVRPGDFVLGSTVEKIFMPDYLYSEVKGRSSYGRLGIEVHKTAGVIDPGFRGEITLEITNSMPYPVKLHSGNRVCQLALHRMNTVASPAYGEDGEKKDNKYQWQIGVTKTRVEEDVEIPNSADE
jgi:dCTP deaminase